VSPFDFDDVAAANGVNDPSDTRGRYEIVGHLRFVRIPHPAHSAART
jgi:hypothetical protein